MTTGLVSGISPIAELTNIVNSTAKAGSTTDSAFSDMLKANSTKQNDVKQADKTDNDRIAKCEGNKTYTKTEKNIKSTEKVENTEEEITDDVAAAAAQAMDVIAEVMGVSVEDVNQALEALGMSEMDLLDTANLSQIVVELAGVEDATAIMTDENLYNDLKDITGQINEILSDLEESDNISYDDIKEIASKLSSKEENETNAGVELEAADNKAEVPAIRNESKRGAENNNSDNQMSWNESIVDSIKAAATEAAGETEATYSTDMEQIYQQVSDSMKLSLTKDVTEMEINLHPASLGNVKIQVAAKDGVITANFTTQNETVKAALETQLVQLKENMAEQGIKVEAIEVSVAAHAFEENLSKEGESSGSGETETKRKRRSINLNEIDENDDNIIVEDEIRIAREMMVQNGTTVDYMA